MIDPYTFGPWVSGEAKARMLAEADVATAPGGDVAALRAHYDAFNERHLDDARAAYDVRVGTEVIGGVRVHVVTPAAGAATGSALVCLHGGAFMWGAGAGALLEGVPVAAVARTMVIAVEYALAPEHRFPVATEEVLVVHRALVERFGAAQVGFYGCSAGAVLVAQATARLIVEGGPAPGAIAMLHGAGIDLGGDSLATAPAWAGRPDDPGLTSLAALPYLAGADPRDPLVFPGEHPALLARFPPSLLVTASRDFAAAAVTVMHRRLRAAGVEAELLHFDGLGHAHHMATTLPESRETFAAIARFFATHLD